MSMRHSMVENPEPAVSKSHKRDHSKIDDIYGSETAQESRSAKRPRRSLPPAQPSRTKQSAPEFKPEAVEPQGLLTKAAATDEEILRLQLSHNVFAMNIHSGTEIKAKVTKIQSVLGAISWTDVKAKPNLIMLHAKFDVASKLISIVEIAKREIIKGEGKVYQYSKVDGILTMIPAGKGKASEKKQQQPGRTLGVHSDTDKTGKAEEQEDPDFEMMLPPGQRRARPEKARNVPVMAVFLTRVPVPSLEARFGSQDAGREEKTAPA